MADDWANENRTVEYQKNTTFKLNQKPGLIYPLAGSTSMYSGASSQIEDQFDDDFNLEDKDGINTDTNNRDASSERRWVKKPKSANVAPLRDRDAMKATSVDIDSPLVEGTARGTRRYHDDKFIEGYFGTAWTGEHGDTPVPFKAGNRIVVDLGGAATGLTEDKIIALAEAYELADCDIEEEQPIVLLTPKQVSDLQRIDRYVKSNYDGRLVLARRELKPWQNLRFMPVNLGSPKAYPRSSKLTKSETTRMLPTFMPSGMHRAVWTEFFGRITERDDKNFSKQVYAEACSTATRLMEDKCFILECKEG
ncbi:phage capsid protein [Stakelama pacifica]|uniref:Uncharacterized protein n=1 Tax=Stakelama pacifica TaxID=517720 RepID=A0A4R6FNG7_9SPHN|nr:phage capsid protein [Stakelama pacifica]TDN82977.1 hypothetical protein EV664_105175 [Stakelama pacifica]GGO95024.1 hypothetical protein GCM10011329_18230 [Stakelama pacifica]